MTYPSLGFTATSIDTNSTTLTINIPSVSVGDLLIVRGSVNDATTFTFPAGFSAKMDDTNVTSSFQACIYTKIVDSASGATTINVSSSVATQGVFVAYKYEASEWSGLDSDIFVSTIIEGQVSETVADPATVTITGDLDDCYFEAGVFWRNGGISCTDYPDNMTDNNLNYQSLNGSGGAGQALATNNSNASSFNPDTFTISSSERFLCVTIGIKTTSATLSLVAPTQTQTLDYQHSPYFITNLKGGLQ